MTINVHNRLLLVGFMLTYCGVMGTLMALSFDELGQTAIKFVLAPVFAVGCVLIGFAKLSHVSIE